MVDPRSEAEPGSRPICTGVTELRTRVSTTMLCMAFQST